MPENEALFVFGDRSGVVERMGTAIRDALLIRMQDCESLSKLIGSCRKGTLTLDEFWREVNPDLLDIAEDREIPLDVLWSISDGGGDEYFTYELFEKLQGPLNLSIDEVLGTPDLKSKKIAQYWEEEHQKGSPMVLAAGLGSGAGRENISINIGLYLKLRAIEELACCEEHI